MKSKLQVIRENLVKGTDYLSTNDLAYYLGYKGNDFYNSEHFEIIKEVIKRQPPKTDKIKIQTSKDIFSLLFEDLKHLDVEEFHIVCLTTNNRVICKQNISKGGKTTCVVDLRVIAEIAIKNKAINVIVAHNHPSGNIQPSEADKQITQKIKNGLKLLDMNLIDHLIIGGGNHYSISDSYYSFADEGML